MKRDEIERRDFATMALGFWISCLAGMLLFTAAVALGTVLLAVRFHKRGERGAAAAAIALGAVMFAVLAYFTLVFILIGRNV